MNNKIKRRKLNNMHECIIIRKVEMNIKMQPSECDGEQNTYSLHI